MWKRRNFSVKAWWFTFHCHCSDGLPPILLHGRADMKILAGFFVVHLLLQSIDCSAIVSLELIKYSNPRGSTAFGRKCDLWPGGQQLPCDPSFFICLTPRPANRKGCLWTNAWMNQNEITFRPGMILGRALKNPILYKITEGWTGQLTIDITVKDEDGLFDDQLDMFKEKLKLGNNIGESTIVMKGETSTLSLKVRSLCIDNSKKTDCIKDCIPVLDRNKRWICRRKGPGCIPRDDDLGHYVCDEITGKKKCLPGWTGKNCLNDVRTEISCSTNYMRIDIDRKYFDPKKYTDINLLDPSCTSKVSETHITLDTLPQSCGAIKTETNDYIIYQNEVYMKARPTLKLVTREHDVRIKFKCSYKKSDITGSTSFRPLTSIDVQEDAAFLYTRPEEQTFSYGKRGYSALTFNLKMFKDQSFKEIQNQFPVKVKLNQSLYFEVNSTSNDDDLVLLIDQCYATPTMNYSNKLKYVFINDGCPKDKTLTLMTGEKKKQRFGINTFAFVKRSRSIFIHCVLFMCRKSSVEKKCRKDCNGKYLSRGKRETDESAKARSNSNEELPSTKYYLLDIGPINGDLKRTNPVAKGESRREGTPVVTIALVAGIAVFGLIAAAMFAWIRKIERPSQYRQTTPGN